MRGKTAAAEDLTAKKELALEVIRRLKAEYPDAGCTLDYDHAWQLLVSVRLAAQCTDARVNVVVQDLFEKYPSVAALAEAEPEDIEAIVKPCGLGRSKARDISACMRRLRGWHQGAAEGGDGPVEDHPARGGQRSVPPLRDAWPCRLQRPEARMRKVLSL